MGSCLAIGNELSEETPVLTKQKTLLGRGGLAESSRVREPGRTALPRGSQSQVFMVKRLVPVLSLANHLAWPIFGPTQGPSWWHVHLSAKMDSSEKDSGRLVGYIMGWRLLPPFGPSLILPVSFQRQHHVLYRDFLL